MLLVYVAVLVGRRKRHDSVRAALTNAALSSLPTVQRINFLTMPIICSVCFSAYECESFDDGSAYLSADYEVECGSEQWLTLALLAGTAIVVHAAIIPGAFFALLMRERQAICAGQPGELANAIGSLHRRARAHT